MDEHGVEYRYIRVVEGYQVKHPLKELNELLAQGWRPIREIPFGASYQTAIMLILLKRTIKKADVTVTEVTDEESNTKDHGEDRQEPPQQKASSCMHPEEYHLQNIRSLP